jgi:methyl-accepting chemotaxis protein
MVEETNAATHNLSDVSANLAALVSRFSVSATKAHVERTYKAA